MHPSNREWGLTWGRTASLWSRDGGPAPPCKSVADHRILRSSQPRPPSSPSQAGHTVNSHTAARVITELGLQQAQPVLHHFPRRGRPVIERPVLWRAEARETGGPGPVSPRPGQGRHSEKHTEGSHEGEGQQAPEGRELARHAVPTSRLLILFCLHPLSPSPGSPPEHPALFFPEHSEPYVPSRPARAVTPGSQPDPYQPECFWVSRPKESGLQAWPTRASSCPQPPAQPHKAGPARLPTGKE